MNIIQKLKKCIIILKTQGIIPLINKIILYFENKNINFSSSQEGEDLVLNSFFENKQNYKGFYVDIGALHPERFSNTNLFYNKGWHGINIDATPHSMDLFNKKRKRDINIECGISDSEGEMIYYSFEEPALNSFNVDLSEKRIKDGCKLKEKVMVKIKTINNILKDNIKNNNYIDFISIDIEGLELKVLSSFDFKNFSPQFFLIEDLDFCNLDISEYGKSPLYVLLKKHDYIPVAKTQRTVIFKHN